MPILWRVEIRGCGMDDFGWQWENCACSTSQLIVQPASQILLSLLVCNKIQIQIHVQKKIQNTKYQCHSWLSDWPHITSCPCYYNFICVQQNTVFKRFFCWKKCISKILSFEEEKTNFKNTVFQIQWTYLIQMQYLSLSSTLIYFSDNGLDGT